MLHRFPLFLSLILTFVLAPLMAAHSAEPIPKEGNFNNQPVIMGWVEYVYLQDLNGRLKAKLDTGATTSSMRGEVIKVIDPVKKGEQPSLLLQIEDADGKITTLQRTLVRWVKIKGKSGKPQRRPVVEMQFCIAGRAVTSEVNIAPRADFIYPILVGRNMLRSAGIIVDSSRSFTAHARCPDLIPADETQDK